MDGERSIDFVIGDRNKWGYEKIGTISDDDLKVITVDGKKRIKAAVALEKRR